MSATDMVRELLGSFDMESYLDFEGIPYRKTHGHSGEQLNVKECPFCGGNSWKVYVNADTGVGNCFHGSCDRRFSKWSFIKAHLGDPANRVVVNHIEGVAKNLGWRPKRRVEVAVEEASGWALPASFELPTPDGQNLVYLENRGIDNDLARYFHLRFCESGFYAAKKPDGSLQMQNFSNRVIIPVYDLDGSLVTFQGRDITGKAEKKYLFPSGLPGTGRFLYNGHNALRAKRVCMGEGAFNVFAIKDAFDEASETRDVVAIGSFGKHLSVADGNDQFARFIQLVQLGLDEVTIMWDGEANAFRAALEAAERLMGLGITVRLALLPAGCDPNEVDRQVVRKAYLNAITINKARLIQLRMKNPYE